MLLILDNGVNLANLQQRNIDELNLIYNLSCQGESGGGAGGGASASGPSMNSLGGTAPTVLSQLRRGSVEQAITSSEQLTKIYVTRSGKRYISAQKFEIESA